MEFQSAKEMYIYFHGSHFAMDREGVYAQYSAFNPTILEEETWRTELIQSHIDTFPSSEALTGLSQLQAHEAIPRLITYADKFDGFFRYRLAETLFDIVSRSLFSYLPGLNIEILEQAEVQVVAILNDLIKNPSQENTFVLNDGDLVDNEYIRQRAASELARYNDNVKGLDKYKKNLTYNE